MGMTPRRAATQRSRTATQRGHLPMADTMVAMNAETIKRREMERGMSVRSR